MKHIAIILMRMTAVVSGLLISCTNNYFDPPEPSNFPPPGLQIKFRVPGIQSLSTSYSVNESEIHELDAVVFREGGDSKEYYVTHVLVPADAIVPDPNDPSGHTLSCTVKVPVSDSYRQRIVFLVNAHEAIERASDSFSPSRPKEALLADLVFEMNGNWPAESPAAFTPFPMWGETGLMLLTEQTTGLSEAVYMMRMVSRVDMSVGTGLQGDFQLQSVYLYNRFTFGRVAPDAAALEHSASALQVNKPSIPIGAQPDTYPLNGEFYTPDTDNPNAVTQRIYLMENPATTKPLEATCFVVGGMHNGKICYYRVDLPVLGYEDLSGGFRAFLRNKRYEVVLKSVRGDGFPTPDEAFEKSWNKVDVDVTVWNVEDILFSSSGTYSLQASPSQFSYLRAGTGSAPGKFSIRSDHKQGWTGEWFFSGADHSWLHVEPQIFRGDSAQLSTFTFTLDENTTDDDRHAYLKITAGNLTKYVDIYQTNQVLADVSINKDIYDWVESGQSAGPLSGTYRLGVSTTHFDANKAESASYEFGISTDFPHGYTTRVIGNPDWLIVNSGAQSSGPADASLSFTVTDNSEARPRSATIEITAGNLVQNVRIVQNEYLVGDLNSSSEWTESEQSGGPTSASYRLHVARTSFDCGSDSFVFETTLAATSSAQGIGWTASSPDSWIRVNAQTSAGPADGTTQPLRFSIESNPSGSARTGIIEVKVGHVTQQIHIAQFATGSSAVIYAEVGNYVTDALMRQSFKLFSHSDWSIRLKSDPAGIFRTLYTTGGKANAAGDDIYFALNTFSLSALPPGGGSGPYEVVLEVSSPSGSFNPIEVKLPASLKPSVTVENVKANYSMNGTPQSFTLKSIGNWKVRKDDSYDIIASFLPSGGPTEGLDYQFTLRKPGDPTIEEATATLTFYSARGKFEPLAV